MDLVEFLTARLDEDERFARDAAPGPWEYQDVESVGGGRICDPTVAIADLHYEQSDEVDPRIRRTVLPGEADGTGAHIARHDPARVLAECEAKRRVVAAYRELEGIRDAFQSDEAMAVENDEQATRRRGAAARCRGLEIAVELLALPYADHPDYRQEWAP